MFGRNGQIERERNRRAAGVPATLLAGLSLHGVSINIALLRGPGIVFAAPAIWLFGGPE